MPTVPRPAVSLLFDSLVDDAGLFPPEELPMAAAVDRHRLDRAAASPVLSHCFICPAARLPELGGRLNAADRIEVAVISELEPLSIAGLLADADCFPGLRIAGLEGLLPDMTPAGVDRLADVLDGLPDAVSVFFEVPVRGDDLPGLELLADRGWSAKIRCGGMRQDLFPTSGALALTIHRCARLGVAFKATAGLHHAIRYQDPVTGFQHHGFLNLLMATTVAVGGGDVGAIAEMLDRSDSRGLAAQVVMTDEKAAHATRTLFRSYGSCSTSDPIDDLAGLCLVPR